MASAACRSPTMMQHGRRWGHRSFGAQPLQVGKTWNLTQAIVRQASHALGLCLLSLCAVLAYIVPLLVADGSALLGPSMPLLSIAPAILVTCAVLYMFCVAAQVSEQCARVPALVNTISFGIGTERERQHTVDYITSSAAGFYIFGARARARARRAVAPKRKILELGKPRPQTPPPGPSAGAREALLPPSGRVGLLLRVVALLCFLGLPLRGSSSTFPSFSPSVLPAWAHLALVGPTQADHD